MIICSFAGVHMKSCLENKIHMYGFTVELTLFLIFVQSVFQILYFNNNVLGIFSASVVSIDVCRSMDQPLANVLWLLLGPFLL